ncbi:hypothetical protein LCGC14_0413800, partial [marine sediment metagenome]
MSTFSAADEYPKLLHEFELAEQRIAKLEAELVDAIEALSNEQETRVLMESERDKLESELITETDCTEKAEAELAEEKFMREITDTGLLCKIFGHKQPPASALAFTFYFCPR